MKKSCIFYFSSDTKNTEKLLLNATNNLVVDLIDVKGVKEYRVSDYENIGFASGIYDDRVDASIEKLISEIDFTNKKPFFIYTCCFEDVDYHEHLLECFSKRNLSKVPYIKILGDDLEGNATGHPDKEDFLRLENFLIETLGE